MKGKHYLSVERKKGWFTVYLNSELIPQRDPRAKFINKDDAQDWAEAEAKYLGIGIKV